MTTLLSPERIREVVAQQSHDAADLRATTHALCEPAAFWVWLGLQPADAPLPTDAHLLEHYYRAHGFDDAACLTECGERDCEHEIDDSPCDGGWQCIRLAGEFANLAGWEIWDVLGCEGLDDAATYGEAFAAFDAHMVEREAELLEMARRDAEEQASWVRYFAERKALRACLAGLLRTLAEVRG